MIIVHTRALATDDQVITNRRRLLRGRARPDDQRGPGLWLPHPRPRSAPATFATGSSIVPARIRPGQLVDASGSERFWKTVDVRVVTFCTPSDPHRLHRSPNARDAPVNAGL
jgi:hypothetical protein